MAIRRGLDFDGVLDRRLVDPYLEVFESLDGWRPRVRQVIGNVKREIGGDVGVAAIMQVILGHHFVLADGEDFLLDRNV